MTGTANCAEHVSREAKVDDRIFNLITQVVDLFKKLDANGDGSISPLEILGFLTSQAAPGVNLPTIPSITDLLKPFDTNNDGNIDLAGKCSLQILLLNKFQHILFSDLNLLNIPNFIKAVTDLITSVVQG